MTRTCAKSRSGALRYLLLTLSVACGLLLFSSTRAAAQSARAHRAVGFWPDIALSLGGGIGIGHPIATNVYAGGRVGILFAYEPWVINLGFAAEVGALPKRGLGAEFELNYLRGPFVQLGYDRIVGGDWMVRAMVGFALFGVQWQHRLSSTPPDNALLFVLRLPLGVGWFFLHDEQSRREESPRRRAAERHPD